MQIGREEVHMDVQIGQAGFETEEATRQLRDSLQSVSETLFEMIEHVTGR
ncbi:hypothetical protein L479_00176 [Exiguobacterium sp. S17]|nr:hypothetical protein L479_00176 [Exiguobacterium sp. S17]